MTDQQLHELFEKHDGEHGKFERIPDEQRFCQRPDLCAMVLLAERFPGEGGMLGSGYDEVVFLVGGDDNWPLTEDDVIVLSRCGVDFNESDSYLYMFA